MKISQLPQDSSPAAADYLAGNQASGPTTQRFKLSDLATFMWTLGNIPAGQTSPITRDNEMGFPFVASGLVWSGDSYGVNRNASMTAGVCYINGRRISISAVTARTFTASKDTYIDVLDNGDGTGTLVYTEVTNNAASPVLASNSIRIGIVITGATTIANSGSINQGDPDVLLPIASGIAYNVTDSLGNLIYCRDSQTKIIGYRISRVNFSNNSLTYADVTGLSACPAIIPAGRNVRVTAHSGQGFNATAGSGIALNVYDSTAGVQLYEDWNTSPGGQFAEILHPTRLYRPAASGARTYKSQMKGLGANVTNVQLNNSGNNPTTLTIELE